MTRAERLDFLLDHGYSWEEASQVADGEPVVATVGGERVAWYPLRRRFGFPELVKGVV